MGIKGDRKEGINGNGMRNRETVSLIIHKNLGGLVEREEKIGIIV